MRGSVSNIGCGAASFRAAAISVSAVFQSFARAAATA
jgi:hypothetical protein